MGCNTSKIGPDPPSIQTNNASDNEQQEEKINDHPQSTDENKQSNVTQSNGLLAVSPDQPLRSILKGSGVKKDWDAIRAKKGMSNAGTHNHNSNDQSNQQPQTMFSDTVTVAQTHEQSVISDNPKESLQQKHARIRSSSSTLHGPAYVEVIDIKHDPASSSTPSALQTGEPSPKRAQSIHTENNQSVNRSANTFTSASSVKANHKKKKRRTSHKGLMSRLALQFPVIRRSLIAVYAAYQQFITHQDNALPEILNMQSIHQCAYQNIPALSSIAHIDSHQLKGVLEHLTNRSRAFSEAEVQELFDLAHLRQNNDDENAMLSFRECLIAIALGYYLSDHPEPSEAEDPNFAAIAQGFKVIKQAFHDMDDDDSGKLDKNELKQALFAASSMNSKNSLLEDRFAELDFNSDGDVELKEFIYGVVSWVNLTTDEEQEEIEQSS